MDAAMYKDILETNLLPFARDKLPSKWMFLQDNDSKHTSGLMMGVVRKLRDGRKLRLPGWFSLNKVHLHRTPSRSPDLNVIENCWAMVKQKLKGERFRNKNELWEAAKEAWNAISSEKLISLVDSMPKRIHAVICARGGHTKY